MQTAAQPHSKTLRRGPAPVSHAIGVECTHEDILNAIAQIAANQQTQFVMIATVAVSLGLNDDDRDWLLNAIHELDLQGRVMLSTVERPQNLALYQAAWCVRNASSIPCHEVCIAPDSHRLKPLLQQHAPALPIYPRAPEEILTNPVLRARRITKLMQDAADTLKGYGSKPYMRLRVLHVEHNQPGEAA